MTPDPTSRLIALVCGHRLTILGVEDLKVELCSTDKLWERDQVSIIILLFRGVIISICYAAIRMLLLSNGHRIVLS